MLAQLSSYPPVIFSGEARALKAKLANVAYDIRLETIAPYECDEAAIFGED